MARVFLASTFPHANQHPGILSCNKEDGENPLYHLKPWSTTCSTAPGAEDCTSATVCKDAALDDPCDAPERCYNPTAPTCYSSKPLPNGATRVGGEFNDARYTLNVTGLPTHAEPTYANWLTGGITTGFVTNLSNVLAGNQVSRSWSNASMDWVTFTEAAGSYATLNPASVSGVTARCNGATVDFRVKWYCALFAPHTPQYPLAILARATEQFHCLVFVRCP